MVRAIYKTQRWVAGAAAGGRSPTTIAGYFPALDRAVLTRRAGAATRRRACGAVDPILPEEGFDRLRRALLASGFLAHSVAFAECVDNRLAEAVIAGG